MKYQAPEGCSGVSVGGEQFNVDDNGHIEVPDDGDYHGLLAPHGFTPAPQAKKSEAELAAEAEAKAKAEAEAKAQADAEAKAAEEAKAKTEAEAKAKAGAKSK